MDDKHIPSLDGIRAFAVILILFMHWDYPYFGLKFGWIGVNLFFVLSGFLITRILLNTKKEKFKIFIKNFIKNRSLRIFPLYFFYLIISFVPLQILITYLGIKNQLLTEALATFKNSWFLLISYTYNFNSIIVEFNNLKISNSSFYGHLWSLSVEEQFYLFFPFLVYFTSKKNLKTILILIVLAGPFVRFFVGVILINFKFNPVAIGWIIYFNTFTQIDALAIGGILATLNNENITNVKFKFWVSFMFTLLIGVLSMLGIKNNGGNIPTKTLGFESPGYWFQQSDTGNVFLNLRYTYLYLLINFTSVLFIGYVKQSNTLKKIFEKPFLTKIGKLSYGIYIYHFSITVVISIIISYLKLNYNLKMGIGWELLFLTIYLLITFTIANLSYKYIELRFLKLKTKN